VGKTITKKFLRPPRPLGLRSAATGERATLTTVGSEPFTIAFETTATGLAEYLKKQGLRTEHRLIKLLVCEAAGVISDEKAFQPEIRTNCPDRRGAGFGVTSARAGPAPQGVAPFSAPCFTAAWRLRYSSTRRSSSPRKSAEVFRCLVT
jgi:hypothetical protein